MRNLNYSDLVKKLVDFIKSEISNRKFDRVIVALSGGVDSAVVALLAKRALGSNLSVVIIPSTYSNSSSKSDAIALCERFDIEYHVSDIGKYLNIYEDTNGIEDKIRYGNFTARVRMAVLYDYSIKLNSLVLGTSNKSELMLGYGTLYGDLAYIVNPIGDLFKSEIFSLARYLDVNKEILKKRPSADLYEGQSDEGDLGFGYDKLDEVLFLIESGKSSEEIIKLGFSSKLVSLCFNKYVANRFKTEGFCFYKV